MVWYLAVFLASLVADLIPMASPPAWVFMVFFLLKYRLNPWLVLVTGVAGSTLGTYLFTLYIPRLARRLIKRQKHEEMAFAGEMLGRKLWRSWLFVFLYSLTPLSTTALFTAAALAKVRPAHTLPPFFLGKFLCDAVVIFMGNLAMKDLADGSFSARGITLMLLGLALVAALLFADWRALLQHRRLRFTFKIWK